MGQISITLNGRTYRLRCEDGEEERLLALGTHVRGHVDRLSREFGQIGDERLLLMAAVLIADELFEAREAAGETPMEAAAPAPVENRKAGGS
jgi:cell division protein ZapA